MSECGVAGVCRLAADSGDDFVRARLVLPVIIRHQYRAARHVDEFDKSIAQSAPGRNAFSGKNQSQRTVSGNDKAGGDAVFVSDSVG